MIWKNVRERKGLYMGLTHFDENGKAVMVDVTDKKETAREAVAEGKILVNRDVFQAVKAGTVSKGDVLAVAATAGIAGTQKMWRTCAAKKRNGRADGKLRSLR